MFDIDLEERLVDKVGGKFKVTRLIQQRLIELNRGARTLIDTGETEQSLRNPPNRQQLMRLIIREILEDKIKLAPKTEIELSIEEEAAQRLKEGKPAETSPFGEEIKKIKEERLKELSTLLQAKE